MIETGTNGDGHGRLPQAPDECSLGIMSPLWTLQVDNSGYINIIAFANLLLIQQSPRNDQANRIVIHLTNGTYTSPGHGPAPALVPCMVIESSKYWPSMQVGAEEIFVDRRSWTAVELKVATAAATATVWSRSSLRGWVFVRRLIIGVGATRRVSKLSANSSISFT